MEHRDVVILGAGPTGHSPHPHPSHILLGLGAATRLNQLKHEDWVLIEGAPEAGGLACTDITPEGFLFDMGGHVIFSHYDYFDELIDAAVGTGPENWSTHERVSYVWYFSPFHLLSFLGI
jgi:protoporphyrinogen oxidase